MQATFPSMQAGSTAVGPGPQKGQLTLGPSFPTTRMRMLAGAGLRQSEAGHSEMSSEKLWGQHLPVGFRIPTLNSQGEEKAFMEGSERSGENKGEGRTVVMSGTFPVSKPQVIVTLPSVGCELARQGRNLGYWGHGTTLGCVLWGTGLSLGNVTLFSPSCSSSSSPRD